MHPSTLELARKTAFFGARALLGGTAAIIGVAGFIYLQGTATQQKAAEETLLGVGIGLGFAVGSTSTGGLYLHGRIRRKYRIRVLFEPRAVETDAQAERAPGEAGGSPATEAGAPGKARRAA